MDCIIKINSFWMTGSSSSNKFEFFYSGNLPVVYLNEVGGISLKRKDIRNKVVIPIVSFSTNNTKRCIEERAANLIHKAGYWGYVKVYVGSCDQRGSEGSEITMCMFYLPGDNYEKSSTITNVPEIVDISRFFPSMNEERMRKNLVVTEVMMT
jgi:hypothetical protein